MKLLYKRWGKKINFNLLCFLAQRIFEIKEKRRLKIHVAVVKRTLYYKRFTSLCQQSGLLPSWWAFLRQEREALSRAHSSSLAPNFCNSSHTCSSLISRRPSKLTSPAFISWKACTQQIHSTIGVYHNVQKWQKQHLYTPTTRFVKCQKWIIKTCSMFLLWPKPEKLVEPARKRKTHGSFFIMVLYYWFLYYNNISSGEKWNNKELHITSATSFLKLTMRNQWSRRGKSSSSALRSSKATLHLQDSWRLKYFTNFPC